MESKIYSIGHQLCNLIYLRVHITRRDDQWTAFSLFACSSCCVERKVLKKCIHVNYCRHTNRVDREAETLMVKRFSRVVDTGARYDAGVGELNCCTDTVKTSRCQRVNDKIGRASCRERVLSHV